jgi:hypothetical protein
MRSEPYLTGGTALSNNVGGVKHSWRTLQQSPPDGFLCVSRLHHHYCFRFAS